MSVWKLEEQVDEITFMMDAHHRDGNYFEYKDYSENLLAELRCLPRFAHISISRELAVWLYS